MKTTFLSVILIFSMVLCGTASWSGASAPVKKLFIIHSYEQGHVCGQPQHEGALKALTEMGWHAGENLELGVYYMDTKRTNNTPAKIAEQAELAIKAVEAFDPDVVLTLDDNAFRTVALPFAGTKRTYVFSGLNGQPEYYDQMQEFMDNRRTPAGNITGVYEKLYIREALRVLSAMHKMDSVLFLFDESPTGKAIKRQVELEIMPDPAKSELPCRVAMKTVSSWEQFKETIKEINEDSSIGAFYMGTLLLKDEAGKTYTAPEIIDYIVKVSRKPAMAINYAFIKEGLYGGATVDFYSMGWLAGRKIADIFEGKPAGLLPIDDAPRVALVFNLTRAEELHMAIPPDILMAADEVFRK